MIIMAVYRPDEVLLARQVESIRKQTLADWDCLVGLDGPDPRTAELLRELTEGDDRFTIIEYQNNVGVYRQFERLLSQVPDDRRWVALSDQDDYWYPEKLERLTPVILSGDAASVSATGRVVTKSGHVLGLTQRKEVGLKPLLLLNQVTGSLTVFHRALLQSALPFPEGGPLARHDHWLAVCAAALGSVRLTSDMLQDYVQHDGNAVGETKPSSLGALWALLRGNKTLDVVLDLPWRWRVAMAREMPQRFADATIARDVASVAAGSLSVRLLTELIGVSLRRDIPLGLGVGFTVAATRRRWRSREAM